MPAVPQRRVPAAAPAPDMGTTADLSDVHQIQTSACVLSVRSLSENDPGRFPILSEALSSVCRFCLCSFSAQPTLPMILFSQGKPRGATQTTLGPIERNTSPRVSLHCRDLGSVVTAPELPFIALCVLHFIRSRSPRRSPA